MLTPLYGGGASKYEVVGAVTGSSTGTSITSNVTPGSDGAYTEIVAATANDWYAFHLLLVNGGTVGNTCIMDVAIGAGGSEIVIIDGVPMQLQNTVARMCQTRAWFPLYIAKGSRISLRVHRTGSASLVMKAMLIGETIPTRGLPPFCRATSYGVNLTNHEGTTVDPGGTANTQGTNTQIVASTTNPITALYFFSTLQDTIGVTAATTKTIQLFVGASGSEVSLIDEVPHETEDVAADYSHSCLGGVGPLPVNIPAGTRISAKARSNSTNAADRVTGLVLIGLD